MKAILLTLKNFFAQAGWAILNSTIGTLWLVIGIVDITRGDPDKYYKVIGEFYFALIMFIPMIFSYLIEQLRTDFSELLPGYRKIQLYSVIPILSIFFVLPMILLAVHGYPVIEIASVTLFTLGALAFLVTKINLDNIFVLIMLAWPIIFLYESFGLASKVIVFGPADFDSFIIGSTASALVIIAVSIGLLTYFVRYYLTVPSVRMTREKWRNQNQYAKDLDVPSGFVERRVGNLLDRNKAGEKKDYGSFRLTRLALFSPKTTLLLRQVFISAAIVLMFYTIFIVANFSTERQLQDNVYCLLVAAFYFQAVTIAGDFLQHRANLGGIWLTGLFKSRRKFAASVFMNYLTVMLSSYIVVSFGLIAIYFILMGTESIPGMFPWIMVGFFVTLFVFSMSLVFSSGIRSDDARGWTIANIFAGMILFMLLILRGADLSDTGTWLPVFIPLAALDALLLLSAWTWWRKTDFSYSMPVI